ncbi:MerR family transcriptional regulator [Streptacidiphilus sp. N1-12]|uniref:MerR family transcriptional regulator n=2 Tax=Streptacidiphilus alkalitolerans TaxID=3342712 RepID=A0ABV6VDP9_9ACTN
MTASATHHLTPAQAAERSGFSLDTLRYYERIGLLDTVERAPSGHRRFTEQDLQWLGILRCLRDTGMPIADMRRYAELARSEEPHSLTERIALLEDHDRGIEEQIALLRAQQLHLRGKVQYYRSIQPS